MCAVLLLSYIIVTCSGNSISCLLGGLLHRAVFSYCFVLCCYCGVYRGIARLLEYLMCCVWLCGHTHRKHLMMVDKTETCSVSVF
jgi:hypothetical protein